MVQTQRIVETLKKVLKARGLTYKDLAKDLQMSEANLKRAFSKHAFTIQRLESICKILDMDLFDLAKQARGEIQDVSDTLNLEQEKALAQDSALFTLFYLLLEGTSVKKIDLDYDFRGKTQLLLSKLDRLRLIDLHPQNRVKLLVATNVRWQVNGPLSLKYEADIKKEYLSASFVGKNERLRFLSGFFSESALKLMSLKVEKLIGEFIGLAETELVENSKLGTRQWLLLAYRPWTFSVATTYRRKGKVSK